MRPLRFTAGPVYSRLQADVGNAIGGDAATQANLRLYRPIYLNGVDAHLVDKYQRYFYSLDQRTIKESS